MRRFRTWLLSCLLLLILFSAAGLYLFYPYHSILDFEVQKSAQHYYLPVTENDHFQILYTHSVHLSDVYEEYTIKQNRLYPYQLIYEDTGIGMPSGAEGDEEFELIDGKYYIKNMSGSYDELTLTIGAVRANHRIVFKEHFYSLADNIGPGKTIIIKPLNVSNWTLWKGEKLS